MKKYTVREKIPDSADEALRAYPPLVRSLLFYRDIADEKKAREYLLPDYERDLHDPFLMLDMEKAVERIKQAVQKNEKIIVYGDYDCDGIPGSVVLHDFFEKIQYPYFKNYIPHRYAEGYGLQMPAIEQFAKDGVTLVITIDCAITDVAEVARANELGIDTIVTDHHLPIIDPVTGEERLPPAFAVINNKRRGEKYPFTMLCGAATAFKLVQGLLLRPLPTWNIASGWEKWLLDMVGTSTVADMVPLYGENRALAHFGLKVLRKSPRLGLQELLRKMNVAQHALTEDDIGFSIAPRINAASRIADPIDGFNLLSTRDADSAITLSTHLESINQRRKGLVAAMIKEAKGKLAERTMRDVIVIGNTEWFPGLVGLAANTLMEEMERPVFVWGRRGTTVIKGSCRSPGNINVVELMTLAADAFIDFGGHAVSGGFSVDNERIHFLENALLTAYGRVEKKE
ncbi:MAG: single-stranded-DNA-specific exonuclease, partial [Parcubacteria group bacterium Greene0416_14]